MAATTANKKTAKQVMTETKVKLSDAKDKMKRKIKSAKDSYKAYKQNIKLANKIGYSSGANDYDKLPKGNGVIGAAKKSYGKALSDGQKSYKLNTKLSEGRKNGKK